LVAGVDTSTRSCTVELRDAGSGRLLGTGAAPHPPTHPPVSEQDPRDWWSALRTALAAALDTAGADGAAVRAIAVGGQGHAAVLLDATGEPVRPAPLWNDTTAAPQAEELVARLGTAGWARAVGSVPTAAFTVAKLARLAAVEPESLKRARHLLLPHGYLGFRLMGEAVTDRSEASGTGYYAAHEERWLPGLLADLVAADIDWPALLPRVVPPGGVAGEVRADVAAELGLTPGAVVAAGAGDQHAGVVGLGARPGDLVVSLGTSGVVMTTTEGPVHDVSGRVDGVADATGRYLPLVCTLNATKVTDAVARWLGVDHAELSRLALGAGCPPGRPVLAAYLDGERSPDRPRARGALAGLTPDTTRDELALAAVEGVLLGLVEGVDALDEAGVATGGRVVVTGGGARSPAYRQVLADLLGREVERRDADGATARGAAVLAAAALDGAAVDEVRDAWAPGVASEASPRAWDTDRVRARYRRLADWDGLEATAGG
jgi:xylulokinase